MLVMKQALELALEALQVATTPLAKDRQEVLQAITAIKEALAQPEQEPVATLDDLEQEIYENTRQFVSRDVMEWMLKRYYTTPPQRKPLTDEEIMNIAKVSCIGISPHEDTLNFAKVIEAVHGIKE